MGRVILDSSVLIAFFDSSDAHHGAVVSRFRSRHDQYEISVLSLTEVLMSPISKSPAIGKRLRAAVDASISVVHPVTEEIAVDAADVRVKTGLKTVDAIISATATGAGIPLWTCDQKLAKAHKGAVLIGGAQ